ncbi:GNAT family N-acetyltransferase [Hoeflea prorocentri]|uniref:GNAT family N-acetyltransferase n=1 Tax=Hoeflea prorocentri TaxID=1922333 RepID=A0A9X3UGS5_9HYPH|nr:GNAT family N-acetyltransferase [Hoeflea prorocentri]MCY6380422.1 GNAT family N-acetyltransferase [Hoeflea prorocentri]MDA5398222.1 GNAT family N-acetyltransferase [Hoeflea prorocentri]
MRKPVEATSFSIQCNREIEPLEPVWRALEAAPECSIHQTYDWCRGWIEETGATPLIITATYTSGARSGETAFILPLCITRSGPFRIARYIATPFNNVNFGVFSTHFLDDANPATMLAIRKQIAQLPLGVDYVFLDRQPRAWHGYVHPFSHWPHVENQNPTFQATLDGGFDAVLSRGNAKRRRKKFRISERRLDELGGYDYIRARTPDEAGDLLEEFFNQKAARFAFMGLPDVFDDAKIKSYFRRLAQESVGQDRKTIEMYAIRLRNRDGFLCAIAALSTKGRDVICQFSSIAIGPTEAASPGELLFYLVIRDACESGAHTFDFGVGDEQFKRSWCDVETTHYDTFVAITPLGHIGALAARLSTDIKRFTKHHPAIFKLAKAIRLWVTNR